MTILIAEDDEDDFFFTARVLKKATDATLFHVESGGAAIEYLAGQGRYSDRKKFPFPDMLLLDLKMDDLDGHGVLAWIRETPASRPRKVFVLTGSGELRDRERVKASGVAADYFVKPLTAEHLGSIFHAEEKRSAEGISPDTGA